MANVIPDLWPDEIGNLDVATPLAILRVQAGQLKQKTRGHVEAAVDTETSADGKVEHYYFDLIAPALNRYRVRLLDAWHRPKQVYPIYVDSEAMQETAECATQAGFVHVLGVIFSSSETLSLITSFIAQSNEKRSDADASAATKKE
jgi:hypothetical protein